MFKQRLLTAMILVPLVLLSLYYANTWFLCTIVVLVLLGCGWEWLQLIPVVKPSERLLYIIPLPFLMWLSTYSMPLFLVVGLLLWGGILLAVITYPVSEKVWGHRRVVAGAGWVLLPLFASTLVAIYRQEQGRDLIVYLLCLIWATDIGAYFAGKQWGMHKLIPMVSPGKTIEGASGGFALAMCVALVGYFYFNPYSTFVWFVISSSTALISVLGDLSISMLKRRRHLKDTGSIFPGHGGLLDRLDSLIAACPLFYCGLYYVTPGL